MSPVQTAKYAKRLEARFEGYFMCRVATDPDPSNEKRGQSGYTMALTTEAPLDQVIRLQTDQYVKDNLRYPTKEMEIDVGVTVKAVMFNGQPWDKSPNLVGANVSLLEEAIFESRNNIVGSDDTMAFAISPFTFCIDKKDTNGQMLFSLSAEDYLNPVDPHQKIWQIEDPRVYGRRLPTAFNPNSREVMQAIGVFDFYAYFRDRRLYLQQKIDQYEVKLKNKNIAASDVARLELEVEQIRSRIYQLEFWGDRVINKLGFQLEWEFDINGPQSVSGDLGGDVADDQPWRVRLWFGGWDGDLLIGYMRGALSMPFNPSRETAV
jgi:hypothetical protein